MPLGVVDSGGIRRQFRQVVAHEVDQPQVGVAAGRVEGDQLADHLQAGGLTDTMAVFAVVSRLVPADRRGG